ncbi:MAG: hypothetical protein AVDCRST_MAG11-1858, partial [uncultured Gemmatimonadaceae bacterium]
WATGSPTASSRSRARTGSGRCEPRPTAASPPPTTGERRSASAPRR